MSTLSGAWPGRRAFASDGDDDLASGPTVDHVPDGRGRLAQRERPVDGGSDLSGLDEVTEGHEVLRVLRRDERAELLAHQRRQQHRPQLAVDAAEPASAGFASDDEEPAVRRERSAEL